jgi:hypothetical protein
MNSAPTPIFDRISATMSTTMKLTMARAPLRLQV